jgi:uncharacterized membrane protein
VRQAHLLLAVHIVSIAFLVGGTAAILVLRSVGRGSAGESRVALWTLLRAVGLRVQLLGLLGAFASGLFLMFWLPPSQGSHWLEVKVGVAMLAGVCAHLDSRQAVQALRRGDARPVGRTTTLLTLVLTLGAIVLVVWKPF